MKKWLFALIFCVLPVLPAAVLKGGMEKPYTIVYADEGNPEVVKHNRDTAMFLDFCLRKAAGVWLAVRAESKFTGSGPAFYVGNTKAAAAKRLIPENYAHWEHHIRILNGNVYLYGSDRQGGANRFKRGVNRFEQGSHKAMVAFLERFAGAVFSGGIQREDSILPGKEVTFPDEFQYDCKPFIQYNHASFASLEQNNYFPSTWHLDHGGHSHPGAVPGSLFKEHPEYFAIHRGKRDGKNLCISNPEVRERIYKEILNSLDQGYEMTEVGQHDTRCYCECENCRNLYGVIPTADPKDDKAYSDDPAWGEKLWRLHRDMAIRLLKDRPGKKICVIACATTGRPPRTFREFPPNMAVELADEEAMQAWQGCKVPAGFTAYIYNWSPYRREGYLPKMSWEACRKQVQDFYKYQIRGIHQCSGGQSYGLEGPACYLWGELIRDPQLDMDKAVKRYCRVIFPGAEEEMEQFYRLLDQRLNVSDGLKSLGSSPKNEPETVNGKKILLNPSWKLIRKRYPEEVIAKLESLLTAAEAKLDPGKCRMLRMARHQFNYMKYTVRAVHALVQFMRTRSVQDWEKAQKQLIPRQKWGDSLTYDGGKVLSPEGIRLYISPSHYKHRALLAGGTGYGNLRAPFTWDNCWYAEHNIRPVGRVMRVNDSTPQYLIPSFFALLSPDMKETGRVFCRLVGGHLKVILILEKELPGEWRMVFQPPRGRMLGVKGPFRNGKRMVLFRGKKVAWSFFRSPAPGVTLKQGECSLEIDINLRELGYLPQRGEVWKFNLCHRHLIWEPNFTENPFKVCHKYAGKLVF